MLNFPPGMSKKDVLVQNKTLFRQALQEQSIQQQESGLENAINYAIFQFYAVRIEIKLIIIKITLKKHGKSKII